MVEAARLISMGFGVLIAVLSLWGIAEPRRLMSMVSGAVDQSWGLVLAVGVRLLLGAALILSAPVARFPLTFTVIGWVSVVAAIALMFMGRELIRQILGFFSGRSDTFVRLWVVLGVLFGGFLIYALI